MYQTKMKMLGKLIWAVCLLFLSGLTAFGAQNPHQFLPSRICQVVFLPVVATTDQLHHISFTTERKYTLQRSDCGLTNNNRTSDVARVF